MKTELKDLRKRDVISCQYGYGRINMIVKYNDSVGMEIHFTAKSWLKDAEYSMSYHDFKEGKWRHVGRYSKLRWYLKM